MVTARWLEKRRPYWARLAEMLERPGGPGLAALSYRELSELTLLYRQVAADLASVREDPTSHPLAENLNQVLARAHNLIYMGRRERSGGVWRFYRSTFPQIFRRTFNYTLFAFAVFLAAATAGCLAALADPSFQRYFLGGAMSDAIERREMWTHSILTIKPLASSAIMTNNLSVSFATFAFGITAGIGTVYMLSTNGLLLGVLGAACWQAGMLGQLGEFVAPHGVLELPSIFIAGGAGLLIARGLLFPGLLPRRQALTLYGGHGVRLALGIIPLLVVAGLTEAFISPTELPAAAKLLWAATFAGLLLVYLARAGRSG